MIILVAKWDLEDKTITKGKRYGGNFVGRQNGVRFLTWNDKGEWETYDTATFEPTPEFFEALDGFPRHCQTIERIEVPAIPLVDHQLEPVLTAAEIQDKMREAGINTHRGSAEPAHEPAPQAPKKNNGGGRGGKRN